MTVNGYVNKDGITINVNSAKALNRVVGHEITHILEGTDLYDRLAKAVTAYAKTKGEYESRLKQIRELYKDKEGYTGEDAEAKIEAELVADLVGDYIFTDKAFVEKLFQEEPGLFKRIFEEIKYLCKLVTAGSKEARQLEKAKKMFEEVVREASKKGVKNPTEEGGVKYSLAVKRTNGEVELVDPQKVTREKILEYMDLSYRRKLEDSSYFPVSSHTPRTIVASLRNAGQDINDKPLAMQAKKARQAQNNQDIHTKDGYTIRGHAMRAEEVIETIDKMEDPDAIIQQTERKKTVVYEDGTEETVELPDTYVVFVTLDSGKECVAVLGFDSSIDPDYIEMDGKGDEYHTTITVFEPDITRKGEPYDYFDYLSSKKSNRVLEIIEESSNSKTANGENLATVSEKELSNNSIRNPEGKVNKNSLSAQEQVEAAGGGWDVRGQDVGLPMRSGYQESPVAVGASQQAQPVNLPGLEKSRPQSQGVTQEAGLPMPKQSQRTQSRGSAQADEVLPMPGDTVRAEQQSLDDEYRRQAGLDEDPSLYDPDEDEGVETTRDRLEMQKRNQEHALNKN